jgi:hypothetical protein
VSISFFDPSIPPAEIPQPDEMRVLRFANKYGPPHSSLQKAICARSYPPCSFARVLFDDDDDVRVIDGRPPRDKQTTGGVSVGQISVPIDFLANHQRAEVFVLVSGAKIITWVNITRFSKAVLLSLFPFHSTRALCVCSNNKPLLWQIAFMIISCRFSYSSSASLGARTPPLFC